MQQFPQRPAAERRIIFKLAQTNDTSLCMLHQALNDYATSADDIVFSGRLFMHGEKVFVDKSMDSCSAKGRFVFVLEFSKEAHNGKEAEFTTGPSLLALAFKSATSIRKALCSFYKLLWARQDGSGRTETIVLALPPSFVGDHSNKGDPCLSMVPEKLARISTQDRVPFSTSPRTTHSPSFTSPIFSPLHVRALHLSPAPKFLPLRPLAPSPLLKRSSAIIRGKDLPFPAVPIRSQQRHSLPVLPIVEGHPKFTKGVTLRRASYARHQMSRPLSTKPLTEVATTFEPSTSESMAQEPLFACSKCPSSAYSEGSKRCRTFTRPSRNTAFLRVPPFPLPHRVSHPISLSLAPFPAAKGASRCIGEHYNNISGSIKNRMGVAGILKKRPRQLRLVDDNTLVQRPALST
ncbi:hypothetical protein BDZ94DRAFT_1250787 [Collybia nuda]|uniref:Uncharacterized protein n=1 Tax=Collybia nuda TaxID=64659 RepID=A0A9P6CNL7_9AGAR|nr:hypothetical protein BDZ94DRAFT_1250787 [Collybia nuda]